MKWLTLRCTICGEPIYYEPPLGLVGWGGVCRYNEDPNQDDQGQHLADWVPI